MFPMETFSGMLINPLDIDPDRILIEDIAHSLSLQCRYGGHCREFYSVAQHSILVMLNLPLVVPPLFGLLHDAAEAYLGDVVSPLKDKLTKYCVAENQILNRIYNKFCDYFPVELDRQWIKVVDTRLLLTEAQLLMPSHGKGWRDDIEPYLIHIDPWPPEIAEQVFLRRFRELT